MSQPEIAKKIH